MTDDGREPIVSEHKQKHGSGARGTKHLLGLAARTKYTGCDIV